MNGEQVFWRSVVVVIFSVFLFNPYLISIPRVRASVVDPRVLKPERPSEVENGTTNKIVLTMLGASTYEYVMTLRNNSKVSKNSLDVRVSFSIPPKKCEAKICRDRDMHIIRKTSDQFYVAAVLDNNDLNRTCRENPELKNRFFYLNYTGFNPYEGQADYNLTNLGDWNVYQVRYTCGIDEKLSMKFTQQDDDTFSFNRVSFGVLLVIAIILGFLIRYYCNQQPAPEASPPPSPPPPQEMELNEFRPQENPPPVNEDEPQQENPATRENSEPQNQPLQAVEPQKTEETEEMERTDSGQRSVSDVNNSGEGTSTQNVGNTSPIPSTSSEESEKGYVNHALDLGESSESPTDSPDAALLRKSNDKEKAKTKKKNKKK